MGTRLKHAPVFFVVGQVRHSPVLKLDDLIPDFQEHLRKNGFPGYKANTSISIEITTPTAPGQGPAVVQKPQTTHTFTSRDETEAFIATSESLAFQTVEYDTFGTLLEKFSMGLKAYNEVVAPELVTGMGLRFLDAIVPKENENLALYLRKELLGLVEVLETGWSADYQFYEASLRRNDQTLKSRAIFRNTTIQMPPDLANTVQALPKRFADVSATHALLDTDARFAPSAEQPMAFDVNELTKRLTLLKKDISDIFKATITDEAIKIWKPLSHGSNE